MDRSQRIAMEVCRDATDLSLAEMAELRGAVQEDALVAEEFAAICATDSLIRARLHDVEVPAGLEQQVLGGLVVHKRATVFAARRQWLALGVGLAAVLLLLLSPVFWGRDKAIETSVPLIQSVAKDDWLPAVQRLTEEQWQPSDQSLRTRVVWEFPEQECSLPLLISDGRSSRALGARAFQLPGPRVAYLVSMDLPGQVTVANVSKGPPRTPFKTGGWVIGVWQEGKTLYVLLVKGSQQDYASRLKRPELT